ncbi:hypothetical protein PPYR_12428 [Photinus pyralis]|uniref:Arf-GAP domain-containing protein n=1 Tax=Photinus pyralis TaxID=7054 RepID=A0A1Y1KNJ3_PHOPY|nr:ARF GTPase-activating protein GIT2 [Photinus pyralis]KAB0795589.1 hypothetical protein PPYR_12428 [Photinus pyralis]
MSRAKSRQSTDICADCSSLDPSWASVNKGIFLCIECCSIHRSLGRHISQVKSIQKSHWSPSQLSMVQTLNNLGINNVWEYMLETNSKFAKRKPNPKDSLHTKAEFIRAKHQQCAFVARHTTEDGLLCVENELGKELHANVRSSNLETSLRLLIQGADPNYFHDEKGSTPLHVAAKANQLMQSELLITYGADPTCPDRQGKTPIDYAKQQIVQDLANRLIECQYDVTDKFSYYLCHRKPDHEKGVHFLIPQASTKCDQQAMSKLRKLSNSSFEELVMDVYDEVERRETEAIWLSSADTVELNPNAVPFLPVDPSLSTTRNQGRQKLGRFTTPELKGLVYDILLDTQRRQQSADKGSFTTSSRQFSQVSDDEPLYDSVASDEDYAHVNLDEDKKGGDGDAETTRLYSLAKKLQDSDSTISDLKAEVSTLKTLVDHLSCENQELKARLSNTDSFQSRKLNGDSQSLEGFLIGNSRESENITIVNGQVGEADFRQHRRGQRPSSMYETREGLKTPNWQVLKNQVKQNEHSRGTTHSMYAGPKNQTLMVCTENVTKGIQQLWLCIQGPNREDCLRCADEIKHAVTQLTAAVSMVNDGEVTRRLLDSVARLMNECTSLQLCSKNGDTQKVEYYLHQVRLCAYEIAKDTKVLVTQYSAH